MGTNNIHRQIQGSTVWEQAPSDRLTPTRKTLQITRRTLSCEAQREFSSDLGTFWWK